MKRLLCPISILALLSGSIGFGADGYAPKSVDIVEVFSTKVLKLYSADDAGMHYLAYVVDWKGHEVVVIPNAFLPPGKNYKVGDTVQCVANERVINSGPYPVSTITFSIAPDAFARAAMMRESFSDRMAALDRLKAVAAEQQAQYNALRAAADTEPDASAASASSNRPQQHLLPEQRVRPLAFADKKYGISSIGVQALDARWSNYGAYMKRLTETVQIEWDRILDESAIYPQPGNTVTVSFVLNSRGEVAKITGVEASTGTSREAKQACVNGVINRAPFGLWTSDMISVLGNEQSLTFTFFYQ